MERLAVSIPNGDKHDFKLHVASLLLASTAVSIPNGDKHDFKPRPPARRRLLRSQVSIPNGDKHDFKRNDAQAVAELMLFQSPMGISMISNYFLQFFDIGFASFQSPMGISMISNTAFQVPMSLVFSVSIPNGDKHDFKLPAVAPGDA